MHSYVRGFWKNLVFHHVVVWEAAIANVNRYCDTSFYNPF